MKLRYALIENGTTLARVQESSKGYSNAEALYNGKWKEIPPADVIFDGYWITDKEAKEFSKGGKVKEVKTKKVKKEDIKKFTA